MKSPATLYLWNGIVDELHTDAFNETVRDVQALFIENLGADLIHTEDIEETWNNYTLRDIASTDIADILGYEGIRPLPLMNQALLSAGKGKRIYLEKNAIESPDPRGLLEARSNKALLSLPLADALALKQKFLASQAIYRQRREQSIALQLDDIDETLAVVYNMESEGLAGAIGMSRPVDIVLPFAQYPVPYGIALERHFRQTGNVDTTLYAKTVAEQWISGYLENYPGLAMKDRVLLGHIYAASTTVESIKDLVDRAKGASRLQVAPIDFWNSYCSRNGLPSIKEALAAPIVSQETAVEITSDNGYVM